MYCNSEINNLRIRKRSYNTFIRK
ncbi:hypothetical protein LINGRAHAP2_LOCUS32015 [Linum grandiflorum]